MACVTKPRGIRKTSELSLFFPAMDPHGRMDRWGGVIFQALPAAHATDIYRHDTHAFPSFQVIFSSDSSFLSLETLHSRTQARPSSPSHQLLSSSTLNV